ncbi:MAG: SGNH/GDSL hydrolase family protein [Vicinamibacterales bacterium]
MSCLPFRPRRGRLAGVVLLAALAAQCSQTPTSPSTPGAVLSRGEVPQGGPPPPAGDSLGTINALGATNYLAFGDSITWGTLSSFDGAFLFDPCGGCSYPSQLDVRLEAAFTTQDFTVTNAGNPGEWAQQAVSSGRFQQALNAQRPQGVLLLEGINDLNNGRSVSAVVGSLQQLVELGRFYNATVLISTMFQTCRSVSPTGTVRENSADLIVPFNNAITAMAAGRQNVYVVNLYGAFGTGNCTPDGGTNLLGADGLHPSTSGYAKMAETFDLALRDRFPVRGSFQ